MHYTLGFSLQNAVCFIMLTCLVPVLFTFYIQTVLKLKKNNNSGAKGLSILAKSLIISFQYNIECVYFFYSNPVFFILKRTERDMIKIVYRLLLSDFNGAWNFPTFFFDKHSNIQFYENLSCGCRVFPSEHTDMTKLIGDFRNCENTSKNDNYVCVIMHVLVMIYVQWYLG